VSASTVGELGERNLVRAIRKLVGAVCDAGDVGPGDDAAVVGGGTGQQAWSVDRQREGTHFESNWLTRGEAGHRAVTIAASDIWAMGAEPRWVLCALELPARLLVAEFEELVTGLRDGALGAGAEIVGGDVGLADSLAMVTTVGGQFAAGTAPLLRSGARRGDELWVIGELGWAAAGRALLARGREPVDERESNCVAAFRRPCTPVAFCRWAGAAPEVHAMMDVSDGLGIDLHRLCEESGVGAEVSGESLADTVPAAAAANAGSTPLDLALRGGDDYSMLCSISAGAGAAVGAAAAGTTARRIGVVTDAASGMVLSVGGTQSALPATGWDPFRATTGAEPGGAGGVAE